jgi:dual specificity protein kinase YAK1
MPSQTQSLNQGQTRSHQAQPRIPSNGHGLTASMSAGSYSSRPSQADGYMSGNVANPPPTSFYPTNTRSRANTINRMDVIPPALARLTHLGAADPAGTRSALTPVLNRDDAIREWERRNTAHLGHAKKASIAPGNPQLDFLQEQAEMMGQAWQGQYGSNAAMQGYRMQPPPPVLESSGRPSQHRSGLSTDFGMMEPPSSASAASPRGYGGNGGSSAGSSYLPAFPPAAASAFDSYDPRGDAISMMYAPLQQSNTGFHKSSNSINPQQNPFATAPNSPAYGGGGYANSPYSPRQPRKRSAGGGSGDPYGGA